jgi:hypothetical protein
MLTKVIETGELFSAVAAEGTFTGMLTVGGVGRVRGLRHKGVGGWVGDILEVERR